MSAVAIPAPVLFADFTSEGITNNYSLNGTLFASFSAWLTGIGGTFSRSSSAYLTNSSGNLAQVSNNVVRFDYDPIKLTPKGLLLEGSSTNLAVQSNSFSAADWSELGVGTPTQNATGPDGVASSAWTITDTNASNFHGIFQGLAVSATTIFTNSAYVKFTNHQFIFLRSDSVYVTYDLINGSVTNIQSGENSTASIVNVGNGWFRITHTFTTVGSGSNAFFIGFANSSAYTGTTYTGTGTDTFLIWGVQQEQAAFASSYIPTTTGTVTRSADSLSATPISSWYSSNNGVLFAIGDTVSPGNFGLVTISDGASTNVLTLQPASSGGTLALAINGGVNQFAPVTSDTGQSPYVANTSSQAAASFQANNFSYVRDGGAADSDFSGAMPASPNTLNLGTLWAGINPNYGHISEIGYWNTIFTVAQLQGLTTGNFVIATGPVSPLLDTTLTRGVPAKAFTKKHYGDMLSEIREEVIAEQEAIGGLDEKGRADRDFEIAQRMLNELESNLTPWNYAKAMDAREKLEAARKARDHHYFMEIVNKEWAKLNG